ncbi:hypothetical protein [Streptomyces sp. NPDC086023]|uniref:hypothetical protein n=1 Tax=Streptomyces sp. NPDC086023 TaxID=3365746 RepID=UPI0037D5FA1C
MRKDTNTPSTPLTDRTERALLASHEARITTPLRIRLPRALRLPRLHLSLRTGGRTATG